MECPENWAEQAFEATWSEMERNMPAHQVDALNVAKPAFREMAVGAYKAGFATAMMQIDITGIFAKNA